MRARVCSTLSHFCTITVVSCLCYMLYARIYQIGRDHLSLFIHSILTGVCLLLLHRCRVAYTASSSEKQHTDVHAATAGDDCTHNAHHCRCRKHVDIVFIHCRDVVRRPGQHESPHAVLTGHHDHQVQQQRDHQHHHTAHAFRLCIRRPNGGQRHSSVHYGRHSDPSRIQRQVNVQNYSLQETTIEIGAPTVGVEVDFAQGRQQTHDDHGGQPHRRCRSLHEDADPQGVTHAGTDVPETNTVEKCRFVVLGPNELVREKETLQDVDVRPNRKGTGRRRDSCGMQARNCSDTVRRN